jgi:hypothetical protein
LRELVLHLVRSLVDDPESVSVEEVRQGDRVVYEVTVAPEDTGKVIGRQGRVINALRLLVKAAGLKTGARPHVEIGP